jgi:hypothetical protein
MWVGLSTAKGLTIHRITKVTHPFDHLAGGQTTGREQDERWHCLNVSCCRSITQQGGSMPQRYIGELQRAEKHPEPPHQPSQSRADHFVASNGSKMFATTKLRHSFHSLTASPVVCHTLDQKTFLASSCVALLAGVDGRFSRVDSK